jgi:glycosyltransferase involved in cell wall biosynthesis
VIADAPCHSKGGGIFIRQCETAAGSVFLSWKLFSDSKVTRKLHLDGGSNGLRFDPQVPESYLPSNAPSVLYSGSVLLEFGLDTLLQAFSQVSNPQLRLHICGKGSSKRLIDRARRDPRVKLLGCVSDEQLVKLARRANVLVNPRPNLPDHDNNFPSKLIEYLSYGKPIVSSWTPGIHPAYRPLLMVVKENTADAFASKIRSALELSNERRTAHAVQCAQFIRKEKLWSYQAERLITWIRESLLKPQCDPI